MSPPRLRQTGVEVGPAVPEDPRIGHLLQPAPQRETELVLLGFPSDEGVRRNGGRVGAAEGPEAIREALYPMTPDPRSPHQRRLLEHSVDLGDLELSGDLERDQEALAEVVGDQLELGRVLVILGGGHETAYGHFLGYVRASLEVSILNIDAHPDVRPLRDGKGHSGSPFRQALEHPSVNAREYLVGGLQPQAVASEHLAYLERRRCRPIWAEEMDQSEIEGLLSLVGLPCLVTLDLDAVDGSAAPGVSAPSAGGLDPRLWLWIAERVGETAAVQSLDVSELNPRFDSDGRTARLAAATVWRFLRGVAGRGARGVVA